MATTIQDVITYVETKYTGLTVKEVTKGSKPIYQEFAYKAASMQMQKKQILKSTVHAETDCEVEEQYVDINVQCSLKGEEKGEVLKGIPPVRVFFKK